MNKVFYLVFVAMSFYCLQLPASKPRKIYMERLQPGLETMQHIECMPLLYPTTTQTKQAVSYDLSGGNNDGYYTSSFVKYYDKNGEAVIFDEYGPGCLYRQQMNIWVGFGGPTLLMFDPSLQNARIKYYFDDEPTPRIDTSVDALFAGRKAPFKDLAFMDDGTKPIPPRYDINRGRFADLYYPITFAKRLKITFVPDKDWSFRKTTWYQNTFLIYPHDCHVKSWSPQTIASDTTIVRQWNNLGTEPYFIDGQQFLKKQVTIPNGTQKKLIDLSGQGVITSLKIQVAPYDKKIFYDTHIKIYWDNQSQPSVDLPLGYLFGGGGENFQCDSSIWKKSLKTLLFGFHNARFYNFYPMPYWSKARIFIENKSGIDLKQVKCEVGYTTSKIFRYKPEQTGYFCAKRTVDHDTRTKPYTLAFHENGCGHVVGLTFYTDGYDMDGDEFTYIDDARTPRIHGSGTEDDHGQGWAGTTYQKALWGGLINGYSGAYRIYMNDSYIFNKNIEIRYEYSTVKRFLKGGTSDITVFYYKNFSAKPLELTDHLDVADKISEAKHNYQVKGLLGIQQLTSSYDGYEQKRNFDTQTDSGYIWNGSSSFNVQIDPLNKGVKIRKRINRCGNGVQSCEVFVDGKQIGIWHIVQSSFAPINQAWQDCDFEIPATYTRNKTKLKLTMKYLKTDGNNGSVNEFEYKIYTYPDK